MRAIILAAGRGSRLYPFTENCPKCLTELAGKTLIESQIDTLRSVGVTDIVIVAGYLNEMLVLPGTQQVINNRWAETNMVESLFCAEDLFGDDLIISYGDIVYEPRVVNALLESPHEISVVVDRCWRAYWEQRFENPLDDAETLRMDDKGRITEIGNPPERIEDIEAQYTGLMRFRGSGIKTLLGTRQNFGKIHRPWMDGRDLEQAYMTDMLMEIILTGHDVHGVCVERGWFEIDTPNDLEVARSCL